jgi:hypothetical protein
MTRTSSRNATLRKRAAAGLKDAVDPNRQAIEERMAQLQELLEASKMIHKVDKAARTKLQVEMDAERAKHNDIVAKNLEFCYNMPITSLSNRG